MRKNNSSLKSVNSYIVLILISTFAQVYSRVSWADESETYSGYDSIVRELSSSRYDGSSTAAPNQIDLIRFHAGIGLITTRVSLDLPKGLPQEKTLRGYEARFGIDLFSPRWVAEGAVRTFDPERIQASSLKLREFDMTVVYHAPIAAALEFVVGGGLAARYLDIVGHLEGQFPRSNTTPASLFITGLNARVTQFLSIGLQLSYRSPLVKDTVDQGSVDGGFRFAGNF